MKKSKMRLSKLIMRCLHEISFKDKGLILIMIILLLQCIHNLYNQTSENLNYASINVVIRTSVAGIFGYFLSSNFLDKSKRKNINEDNYEDVNKYNLEELEEDLKVEEKKCENQNDINCKEIKEIEEKERYICNEELQNGVAIFICIVIMISLIIGVNFNLISNNSIATISQFRDLMSGSIGFLIGNSSNSKK